MAGETIFEPTKESRAWLQVGGAGLFPVSGAIASGQSLSAAIDLKGARLGKITMPAAWTAADLTFQTSSDNGATWQDLYDAAGAVVTVKADANRAVIVPLADWLATGLMKIRSGTPSTPVNQAAARTIILVTVP